MALYETSLMFKCHVRCSSRHWHCGTTTGTGVVNAVSQFKSPAGVLELEGAGPVREELRLKGAG